MSYFIDTNLMRYPLHVADIKIMYPEYIDGESELPEGICRLNVPPIDTSKSAFSVEISGVSFEDGVWTAILEYIDVSEIITSLREDSQSFIPVEDVNIVDLVGDSDV